MRSPHIEQLCDSSILGLQMESAILSLDVFFFTQDTFRLAWMPLFKLYALHAIRTAVFPSGLSLRPNLQGSEPSSHICRVLKNRPCSLNY